MTRRLCEGFDSINTANSVLFGFNGLFASRNFSTTAGRFGGPCITFNSNGNLGNKAITGIVGDNIHMGFAIDFAAAGNLNNFFGLSRASFVNPGNSANTVFYMSFSAATLMLTFLSFNGTVMGTLPIKIGEWFWLALDIKALSTSSGQFIVSKNNNVVFTYNGAVAGASATGTFWGLNFSSTIVDCFLDDIIVDDESGTVNNGNVKDTRIVTLRPAAVISASGFTANTGTTATAVAEQFEDTDVTYNVSTAQTGSTYLNSFASLPVTATGITSVVNRVIARENGTDPVTLSPTTISGGTTRTPTAATLSTSYTVIDDLMEVDPHTSTAWTTANVNLIHAGVTI